MRTLLVSLRPVIAAAEISNTNLVEKQTRLGCVQLCLVLLRLAWRSGPDAHSRPCAKYGSLTPLHKAVLHLRVAWVCFSTLVRCGVDGGVVVHRECFVLWRRLRLNDYFQLRQPRN